MTPAKRAPYGWCMGAIFCSEALIQGESLFFFFLEGIPPAWLLWYRLAGSIYIHTVTRTPAPSNRKGSRLVFNRSLATELKQADATGYGWNLHQQVPNTSFIHLTNYFSRGATRRYWLYSWLINCLVCRESANYKNVNGHHVSPERIKCLILAEHQTKETTHNI